MPSIGPDDAARHPGQIGAASPALFARLVDDASMFPPRSLRLDEAVSEHQVHHTAGYAEMVGPLVVLANYVEATSNVAYSQRFTRPVRVSVVAPDGLIQAREAAHANAFAPLADVDSVELPLDSVDDVRGAWSELGANARPVWWEIDRAGYQREQLGRLAGAARSGDVGGAKLRVGGPSPSHVPSEEELAAFLRHAIDLDLSFKLTAGLHHAVRGVDPGTGLDHHGVLNVLCALKAALNGAEEAELAAVLAERDSDRLVSTVNTMSEADAAVIRAFWSSFGCCDVTDPIRDLVALGLLSGPEVDG